MKFLNDFHFQTISGFFLMQESMKCRFPKYAGYQQSFSKLHIIIIFILYTLLMYSGRLTKKENIRASKSQKVHRTGPLPEVRNFLKLIFKNFGTTSLQLYIWRWKIFVHREILILLYLHFRTGKFQHSSRQQSYLITVQIDQFRLSTSYRAKPNFFYEE